MPDRHTARVSDPAREQTPAEKAMVAGTKFGMDMAVGMARDGNLRLYALPFEKGERPYERRLRPWAITVSAWRAWYRERTGRCGFRKLA